MTQKNMNASPSYNDFYFISDLDRTLIYSKRAIQESDPEYCKNLIPIEYKDGRVISYMNKNAYDKLQKLIQYEEFKFLPCTMRTLTTDSKNLIYKRREILFYRWRNQSL